jgi:hypothetical protein
MSSFGYRDCVRPLQYPTPLLHLHLVLPPDVHLIVYCIRASCSGLPIKTGCHPCVQRHWSNCAPHAFCDEEHIVINVPGPGLLQGTVLWFVYPHGEVYLDFMWQRDTCAVAISVAHASLFMEIPHV